MTNVKRAIEREKKKKTPPKSKGKWVKSGEKDVALDYIGSLLSHTEMEKDESEDPKKILRLKREMEHLERAYEIVEKSEDPVKWVDEKRPT